MRESALLARAEAANAGPGALTAASARQIGQAAHAIHNWGSHTHVHIYVQSLMSVLTWTAPKYRSYYRNKLFYRASFLKSQRFFFKLLVALFVFFTFPNKQDAWMWAIKAGWVVYAMFDLTIEAYYGGKDLQYRYLRAIRKMELRRLQRICCQ